MRDAARAAWRFLAFAFDVLVPRFLTEDVALVRIGLGAQVDDWEVACSMRDVQPNERFDAVGTVDSFAWLGGGITYRMGNVRPWPGRP